MLNNNELDNENIINDNHTYDQSYEISSWDDTEINHDILRGIYAYGFDKPSPIQQKAIKPIISGKDIIAQAQSGTGKTAAFAIGNVVMSSILYFSPLSTL